MRKPDRRQLLMIARSAFFVLLAINISYYTWISIHRQPMRMNLPPVPEGVGELKLIREREAEMLQTGGDLGVGSDCYSLGPFQTQTDLRRAANAMAPYVAASRQRQEQQVVDRGFWVYLPAVETRERALNQARALSEAGLKDYYVVTAGDRENTVSLGLFRDENNALRRQAALIALGFDAQVMRRREETRVFWFDYRRTSEASAPWQAVVASSANIQRRPVPCFR